MPERPPCRTLAPIIAVEYPAAAGLNPPLAAAFARLGAEDFDRRSHFVGGRFENLYLRAERLPGLPELLAFATATAADLITGGALTRVGADPPAPVPGAGLRCGFWLNAMAPGQATSRHTHDENDELASGVYYVAVPPDSGEVRFHDGPFEVQVRPWPGLLLFFPPDLAHSVGANCSSQQRLSIAFNFGPDPEGGEQRLSIAVNFGPDPEGDR